jgi:hypothetical protein
LFYDQAERGWWGAKAPLVKQARNNKVLVKIRRYSYILLLNPSLSLLFLGETEAPRQPPPLALGLTAGSGSTVAAAWRVAAAPRGRLDAAEGEAVRSRPGSGTSSPEGAGVAPPGKKRAGCPPDPRCADHCLESKEVEHKGKGGILP